MARVPRQGHLGLGPATVTARPPLRAQPPQRLEYGLAERLVAARAGRLWRLRKAGFRLLYHCLTAALGWALWDAIKERLP